MTERTPGPRSAGLALVLAALLGVTSCGGDGGAEGGDGAAATSVEVAADEYAFDPADVAAAGGQDVEVTLDNVGQLPHEWVVLTAGTEIASEDEFSEDLVAFRVEANPGQAADGSMSLEPGDYQVICSVPGHFDSGMEGALTLE